MCSCIIRAAILEMYYKSCKAVLMQLHFCSCIIALQRRERKWQGQVVQLHLLCILHLKPNIKFLIEPSLQLAASKASSHSYNLIGKKILGLPDWHQSGEKVGTLMLVAYGADFSGQ